MYGKTKFLHNHFIFINYIMFKKLIVKNQELTSHGLQVSNNMALCL